MDLLNGLAVKGYCFRGYKDNETVAQKVKDCGVSSIDLSGCQLNFRDASLHDSAIEIYRDAGVDIVGIGAVPLTGAADDEEYFKFCRKAGCKTISMSGSPETFFDAVAQAEKWAEEYGMFLAIHNHGGKHWLGSSEMLKYVLGKYGDRVGLCIDTAWCIQAGENPLEWLEIFSGRVHAVHFKDFIFSPDGSYYDTIIGQGALDLPAFVNGLEGIGFNGPAILEYEADVDNPVPSLSECVRHMRQLLSATLS